MRLIYIVLASVLFVAGCKTNATVVCFRQTYGEWNPSRGGVW